jgi:hypothetical protein
MQRLCLRERSWRGGYRKEEVQEVKEAEEVEVKDKAREAVLARVCEFAPC